MKKTKIKENKLKQNEINKLKIKIKVIKKELHQRKSNITKTIEKQKIILYF